jgi:hypothetical protein
MSIVTSRSNRRSMSFAEKVADPDYHHPIFSNWVVKLGVLGNAIAMFLTLVAAFAVPVIVVTTRTEPATAQAIVVFAYFWALIGMVIRRRDSSFRNVVIIRTIVGIIAFFMLIYGSIFLFDIRNFEISGSPAVGMSVIFVMFFLSLGDVFAPIRLLFRIGLRIRNGKQ